MELDRKRNNNKKRRVVKKETSAQKNLKKEKGLGKTPVKKKNNSGSGVYYSFFTIILFLCLIQITISAVLNVSKVVSYKAKIVQISKTRDAAKALNEQLKDNINNFSNVAGLEAIARNNLKMSSDDEVLVIINTAKDEVKEERPKKMGFIKHD
ncbi:septum formation initiator family protein [bacterium]|nr:septum formation initiator family protein [bacterium]